jgi:hypothetical protein
MVLETTFTTADGTLVVTHALSTGAGERGHSSAATLLDCLHAAPARRAER